MMMEQQMILKSDEKMQDKWNCIIVNTSYSYNRVERIIDALKKLNDTLTNTCYNECN